MIRTSFSVDSRQSNLIVRRFVFALLSTYSPQDVSAAAEALSLANTLGASPPYCWDVVSPGGTSIRAANGLTLQVDGDLGSVGHNDTVIVCGGSGLDTAIDAKLLGWLRRAARQGAVVGALGGGVEVLAKAGLLSGHAAATHWSLLPALAEIHPAVDLQETLFSVGPKRMTCAGGAATIDLFLNLIGLQQGKAIAARIADTMVCSNIRTETHAQTVSDSCRLERRNDKLSAAMNIMRENVETPVSHAEIAKSLNVSTRQLERLFARGLNTSPKAFYTRLRLDRARTLLLQTDMRVIDVAVACGFSNATHFSKVYRKFIGVSPTRESGFSPVVT